MSQTATIEDSTIDTTSFFNSLNAQSSVFVQDVTSAQATLRDVEFQSPTSLLQSTVIEADSVITVSDELAFHAGVTIHNGAKFVCSANGVLKIPVGMTLDISSKTIEFDDCLIDIQGKIVANGAVIQGTGTISGEGVFESLTTAVWFDTTDFSVEEVTITQGSKLFVNNSLLLQDISIEGLFLEVPEHAELDFSLCTGTVSELTVQGLVKGDFINTNDLYYDDASFSSIHVYVVNRAIPIGSTNFTLSNSAHLDVHEFVHTDLDLFVFCGSTEKLSIRHLLQLDGSTLTMECRIEASDTILVDSHLNIESNGLFNKDLAIDSQSSLVIASVVELSECDFSGYGSLLVKDSLIVSDSTWAFTGVSVFNSSSVQFKDSSICNIIDLTVELSTVIFTSPCSVTRSLFIESTVTVPADSSLTLHESTTFTDATFTGPGYVIISDDVTFKEGVSVSATKMFFVNCEAQLIANADVSLSSNAFLSVNSSSTLSLVSQSLSFTQADAASTFHIEGVLNSIRSNVTLSTKTTGTGSFNFSDGSIVFSGSGIFNGDISLDSAIVSVVSPSTHIFLGTLITTNTDLISIISGSIEIGGLFIHEKQLLVSGGTLTLSQSNKYLNFTKLHLINSATLRVSMPVVVTDFRQSNSSILTGANRITITDVFNFYGGTININTVHIPSSSEFYLDSVHALSMSTNVYNNGTIHLKPGSINTCSNTIIDSSGLISTFGDSVSFTFVTSASCKLINRNEFVLSNSAAVQMGFVLENFADFSIDQSSIDIRGSGFSLSNMTGNVNSSIVHTAAVFTYLPGSETNYYGSFSVTGGTTRIFSLVNSLENLFITGGTAILNVPSETTDLIFSIQGGILSVPRTMNVTNITISTGTLTVGGTLF
ncbi:hypothetical protein GEMRC1_012316 [Eukaryota sp. GEM-RC1]